MEGTETLAQIAQRILESHALENEELLRGLHLECVLHETASLIYTRHIYKRHQLDTGNSLWDLVQKGVQDEDVAQAVFSSYISELRMYRAYDCECKRLSYSTL